MATQIFFNIFIPDVGEMIHFDYIMFSNGLKPGTRWSFTCFLWCLRGTCSKPWYKLVGMDQNKKLLAIVAFFEQIIQESFLEHFFSDFGKSWWFWYTLPKFNSKNPWKPWWERKTLLSCLAGLSNFQGRTFKLPRVYVLGCPAGTS